MVVEIHMVDVCIEKNVLCLQLHLYVVSYQSELGLPSKNNPLLGQKPILALLFKLGC